MNFSRRKFLLSSTLVAVAGAGILSRLAKAAEGETIVVKPGTVTIQRFTDLGKSIGKEEVQKVIKTEAEWKKLLSPLAFEVTRQEGTETAFTGPYWDNHAPGLYRCICCDNALYLSDTKYDSQTGWPSFWQPIAKENLIETDDTSFGMTRTKVSCKLCEAHLGHVFDDGPQP